jgi:ParB-like chromosome segregation protein Spo0J
MAKQKTILGAKIHPQAAMFPEIAGKEFDDLCDSIEKHGITNKIVVLERPVFEPVAKGERDCYTQSFTVIDGRNRLRAIERLKAEGRMFPNWREWTVGLSEVLNIGTRKAKPQEITAFIAAANVHRRHLTPDQQAAIYAELYGEQMKSEAEVKQIKDGKESGKKGGRPRKEEAGKTLEPKSVPGFQKRDLKEKVANSTAGKIAKAAGVSRHKASEALAVRKAVKEGRLDEEVLEEVKKGTKPLAKAKKEIKPKPKKEAKVATRKRAKKPVEETDDDDFVYDRDVTEFRRIAIDWKYIDPEGFREELETWLGRLN